MDLNSILSIIGIALNTIGIVFIFVWGLSPLVSTKAVTFIYSADEHTNPKSKSNIKRRKYKQRAIFGLFASVFGGILQIITYLL